MACATQMFMETQYLQGSTELCFEGCKNKALCLFLMPTAVSGLQFPCWMLFLAIPPVILFTTPRKTVGVAWQGTWFLLYEGVRWQENAIISASGWKEVYVPGWKCNLLALTVCECFLLSWFSIERPRVHNWPKQKGNSEIEIPWNWSTERISKSRSIYVCAHLRQILFLVIFLIFYL